MLVPARLSCRLCALSPPGSTLSVLLEEIPVSSSGHAALHAGQCGQSLVVAPLGCVFGMNMVMVGGGGERGWWVGGGGGCVQALLTVLVLLLCAGRFVWAALEWMRSNATLSSRTTSGPLRTSERVSVCVHAHVLYINISPQCRGRFLLFHLCVSCSFPTSRGHSSSFFFVALGPLLIIPSPLLSGSASF